MTKTTHTFNRSLRVVNDGIVGKLSRNLKTRMRQLLNPEVFAWWMRQSSPKRELRGDPANCPMAQFLADVGKVDARVWDNHFLVWDRAAKAGAEADLPTWAKWFVAEFDKSFGTSDDVTVKNVRPLWRRFHKTRVVRA